MGLRNDYRRVPGEKDYTSPIVLDDRARAELAKAALKNKRAKELAEAAEMTNLSFILTLKHYFASLMAEVAKTILFPVTAGVSCIQAILAVRQAYLERDEEGKVQKSRVIRAVVEIAVAVALIVAVIGTFVASALFATVAPIIAVVAYAVKTVYHIGAAIYNFIAGGFCKNQNRDKYLNEAKRHAISGLASLLVTAAAGLCLLFSKATLGVVGIVGAAIGATYAVYKACTTEAEGSVEPSPLVYRANELDSDDIDNNGDMDDPKNLRTPEMFHHLHNNHNRLVQPAHVPLPSSQGANTGAIMGAFSASSDANAQSQAGGSNSVTAGVTNRSLDSGDDEVSSLATDYCDTDSLISDGMNNSGDSSRTGIPGISAAQDGYDVPCVDGLIITGSPKNTGMFARFKPPLKDTRTVSEQYCGQDAHLAKLDLL